ncbi:hypothetical protein E3P99_03424 [Wallemia hederae]|uniref:NAD-dependent epimerase/dehydratase domain-containing protein n=1 Tax=Wallemia hederae TaxID=1540922 RepID=A0A4T0FGL9_9BASI|nr:hypothetical protein E3P99_03424 [Wallemia hederae]
MPSVFITGATGLIGSAVVRELQQHGYAISALARSDASATKLASQGVNVVRGSLENTAILKAAASEPSIDGVIHLAFIHDFANYATSADVDAHAIAAFGEALKGTRKALLVSSVVAGLDAKADDGIARETDSPLPSFPRKSETTALQLKESGITPVSVRLAPTVHAGADDRGFMRILMNSALTHKKAVYVEPSHWPAVHADDAASLFRLAFEAAMKGRSAIYHGVAEQGIAFKEIAEAIARKTGTTAALLPAEEAFPYINFLSRSAPLFKTTSSEQTRSALGWSPTRIGLLEDIEKHYTAQIQDSFL